MTAHARPGRSRRTVLKAGAAVGIGVAGTYAGAQLAAARSAGEGASGGYLVGRGISDATGEIAEVGMMGYGRFDQQANGLHTRLRSRAFIVVDEGSGKRVALVVVDATMIFESVHQSVLRRLGELYGNTYNLQNVLIVGTHTHCGPAGHSHHFLYNTTSYGFHKKTFDAMTAGIVESVQRAHEDLAPSELVLSHTELKGASANRSKQAFDLNKDDIKKFFPEAVDSRSSLLRVEREGKAVGAVNFFPVHATNMSGDNRLISADNKGFAAYHWEREVEKVDYLDGSKPAFVAAFAQTNSGDMSPHTDLKPPTTPEDFHHTHENGLKQYEAAARQLEQPGRALTGGVDAKLVYVNLSEVTVRPEFTGDGLSHRTSAPCIGASMAAGSLEDGPAFPGFTEGENPFWDAISESITYKVSPALKEAQSPKDVFVPVGELNKVYPWVQEEVPLQIVRIGSLHLVAVPGEVTIGAGYRLRSTVAKIVGAEIDDVLVAGYANSYFHYLTTPEEYDSQQYEGGSTLFGRWQLGALMQTYAELATALKEGKDLPLGPKAPDLGDKQLVLQPGVVLDTPPLLKKFGDVLVQPRETYRAGEQVEAVFAGAHPGNDLHRGGTYLAVERQEGSSWRRIADDGDWATKFHWARDGVAHSKVTVTWDVPQGVQSGTYRIRYHGDSRRLIGVVKPFTGTTRAFTVR